MTAFPVANPGQTIGLLGGSFDPPHAGHVHITKAALKRFGLDRVWWLVSPGNPLKTNGPAPLAVRMQAAAARRQYPRVTVTDIEAQLGCPPCQCFPVLSAYKDKCTFELTRLSNSPPGNAIKIEIIPHHGQITRAGCDQIPRLNLIF